MESVSTGRSTANAEEDRRIGSQSWGSFLMVAISGACISVIANNYSRAHPAFFALPQNVTLITNMRDVRRNLIAPHASRRWVTGVTESGVTKKRECARICLGQRGTV
jgi:hypothetical protein